MKDILNYNILTTIIFPRTNTNFVTVLLWSIWALSTITPTDGRSKWHNSGADNNCHNINIIEDLISASNFRKCSFLLRLFYCQKEEELVKYRGILRTNPFAAELIFIDSR